MKEYRLLLVGMLCSKSMDLAELKKTVISVSYQKRGLIGSIEEREVDGTVGVPWQKSHIDFTLTVSGYHFGANPNADTIHCIDGTVIGSYGATKLHLMQTGWTAEEATQLMLL